MEQPSEAAWEALKSHTAAERGYAPTRVMLVVASLVDPESITAAVTTADLKGPSVWSTTLATAAAIARVVASFDVDYFDLSEEQAPQYRNNAPEMTLTEAWVRPLSSVRRLAVADVTAPFAREKWYQVNGMTLTFEDGEVLNLPSQDRLYHDGERHLSDALLAAVRRGVGF